MKELESIKELISKNKIEVAIDKLISIADSQSLPQTLNSLLLIKSRTKELMQKELLGVGGDSQEKNKLVHSLLEIVDETQTEINNHSCSGGENCSSLTSKIESNNLPLIFNELVKEINLIGDLDYNAKEELYLKNLAVQSKLKENIHKRIGDDFTKILSERIFYSEKIEEIELNQLFSFPYDNKKTWKEKHIIISAITFHLFKNFNPNLIEVLINFTLTFEDRVWRKSLASLILVLRTHLNRVLLFPDLINKLEKLREIKTIQDGINRIEFDLSIGFYKRKDLNITLEFDDEDDYWKSIYNWFTPFYEGNEILENQKSKFPNVEGIHKLPNYLIHDKHSNNVVKYWFTQNITHFETKDLGELIEKFKTGAECKDNHKFDTILSDYYFFSKYFSKDSHDEIFRKKKSLYESSLLEVVSSDYEKYRYMADLSYFYDKKEEALKYYLKAIELNPTGLICNFCKSLEILAEMKDFKNAGDICIKAHNNFPTSHFLNRAITNYHKGSNYSEVKKYLPVAIDKTDDFKELRKLALVYYDLKDYDSALITLKKATKDYSGDNENVHLNHDISSIFFIQNNQKEAKEYLEKSISQYSSYDPAYVLSYLINYKLRKEKRLPFEYFKSIEEDINDKEYYFEYSYDLVSRFREFNKSKSFAKLIDELKTGHNNA